VPVDRGAYARILVPLDGSALAERALPYALELARAGARLELVHVHHRGQPAGVDLDAVAERLSAAGATAEAHVGAVADGDDLGQAVVGTARELGAELIVMSTHGRSGLGRWIYGSVADQVLRQSPVPVLLVPPGADPAWPHDQARRLLVPLDSSPLAEQALGPAVALAGALAAGFVLLSVVVPPPLGYGYFADRDGPFDYKPDQELATAREYLEESASRLRHENRPIEVRTAVDTAPGRAIADAARELGVHAIALATHGSGRLTRLVMGSVATEVVRLAAVPVLLVRPTEGATVRSA
jgi:nucleotide-binding universal stress UspA family protein